MTDAVPQRWTPRYTLSPAIVRGLMAIEASRAVVAHTPLPPDVEAALRQRARVRSVHYSTRIEGNRLTLAEAEEVIAGRNVRFHGRERDRREVQNYWNALLRVEEWAAKKTPLSEALIRRLHALVEKGARARPTPYRDGQNAIRDSGSGALVYLPPEAKDVPGLMAAMVRWAVEAEKEALPVPLIAGLMHYQFVTIHPFYDGNGRTARLLATFLLHRGGYGLNGFFSLEEHHARDLAGYYRALVTHPHHNYYEGREHADLTPWLESFVAALTEVFSDAQREALRLAREGVPAEPEALRRLDRRGRAVLALFFKAERITSADVAQALGLSDRMARVLLRTWVKDGWLTVANVSNRARGYELSAIYRQYIDNLSAMPGSGKEPS
ncbi:MAG: cell filamentation protein Fic [Candidatus Handelsmanbacteria bacterium RIFCSPLOWO2_12_FULL_64_10]|uniref:Cell filamentation protein Fic n=1 Tax=Handelsmanbacteria sp. (strain RIFCSPLOWO2_12_FULL_64_10) TaxID=1817868 RepID=A0A1F6C9J4_HANXR|nr:MAG: cell filamentation protein Fic [Candidatus Handelsmanbacteria bacterium RIFCSPLOWO2_12_FULL_64_10]